VRRHVEEHDEETLVALYSATTEGGPLLAKRVFDIIVSGTLLLLLSPLLLIVALIIRKTSPWPVFFSNSGWTQQAALPHVQVPFRCFWTRNEAR
jgi:lipopolysaccharide/colanic/teichoic acid biosynthesis glycosyltransferase